MAYHRRWLDVRSCKCHMLLVQLVLMAVDHTLHEVCLCQIQLQAIRRHRCPPCRRWDAVCIVSHLLSSWHIIALSHRRKSSPHNYRVWPIWATCIWCVCIQCVSAPAYGQLMRSRYLNCRSSNPNPDTHRAHFTNTHCLVTHLSASDSFATMALYKFIYLLTYLLTSYLLNQLHHRGRQTRVDQTLILEGLHTWYSSYVT